MNSKFNTPAVKRLAKSLCVLETQEEYIDFLEDVCTTNEIMAIAQRHEVAYMLQQGRTYLEIAEETGASTATISRVKRSLSLGGSGYEKAFARMKEE